MLLRSFCPQGILTLLVNVMVCLMKAHGTEIATLGDLSLRATEVIAECLSFRCGAQTPLLVSFFAARYAPETPLDVVAAQIKCAACGSPVIFLPVPAKR